MSREIRTERLRLRPQEPRDTDDLIRIAPPRQGETPEALAARLTGHSQTSDQWFAEHGYGVWIMEEQDSSRMVGFIGAKPNAEPGKPELMYGLDEGARGRGYAAEAAQGLVRHLFSLPGTTEVWAQADPDNVPSWRVMERLGMRFEFRGMLDGADSVVYRMLRAQHESKGDGLVEPTPWALPEILAALERSVARTTEFFVQIPAERFFAGDAQHWGPAYHLGHLIMTHAGVARGLRAGRRLPAHRTGRSRGSHELGVTALAALTAAPAESIANNPLTPTLDQTLDAARMGAQLLETNAALRAVLAPWTEQDLDARALPHPYLGPITVREMLLFMPLHDGHHVAGVRRRMRAEAASSGGVGLS